MGGCKTPSHSCTTQNNTRGLRPPFLLPKLSLPDMAAIPYCPLTQLYQDLPRSTTTLADMTPNNQTDVLNVVVPQQQNHNQAEQPIASISSMPSINNNTTTSQKLSIHHPSKRSFTSCLCHYFAKLDAARS